MASKQQSSTWRYLGEFSGAMGAYIGVLMLSISLRDQVTNPVISALVNIAPILPTLLVLWAILRQYGRFDELQQRVQSEALSLSAVLTALGTFTYGFLENAGFPPLNIIWVLPILIGLQGISVPFIARRYR